MTYTKNYDAWGAGDEITALAMNHLESQWTEIKADADAHLHEDRYYNKTLADVTFFSTSYYTGFDADLLDGQHFTDLVANVMPIGAIMIWSGTDANVPANWAICDGSVYGAYTTPDLRDRFVPGAGSTYAVNATGGPATWDGTFTPTGLVSIASHTLSLAELPPHVHSYAEYYNLENAYDTIYNPNDYVTTSRSTAINNQNEGGGSGHGHAGSTASFTAIDPRPKYYALYYIMKVV
jgi:microcystin-dependent protein